MIPIAGILGILRAGASLATAVRDHFDKTPDPDPIDFNAIADAVGNLVTQGKQLFEEAKDVLSSDDEGQIRMALQTLQAENDALYQSVSAKLDAASKTE